MTDAKAREIEARGALIEAKGRLAMADVVQDRLFEERRAGRPNDPEVKRAADAEWFAAHRAVLAARRALRAADAAGEG